MLIFLDAETTGLEHDDKICSLALIAEEDSSLSVKYELLNEGKKISSKASSVNHITNEMIQDKPKLQDSEIFGFLQNLNTPENTIIGHNINFDLAKLASSGFGFKGSIVDTMRVAKHLIPECESYSLQFLRYELKLYRGETNDITPHNALSDTYVLKSLYENFLESATLEEMQNLSFKNVLLEKFNFGKYKGRYIEEISLLDRGYLEWMLSSVMDLDEDLRYSIDYYLRG